MHRGKQVVQVEKERWKTTEYRERVVHTVAEELIAHGLPLKKFSFSHLVQSVERFEEKANTSAKTEDEYLDLVTAKVKSIHALSRKAAEARNLLTNPSGTGTNSNFDWPEHTYQELQILKNKYNAVVRRLYEKLLKKLQPSGKDLNSKELEKLRHNKSSMEFLFSLFELSKNQITPDMKYRPIEANRYIQSLLKVNRYTVQHSPDLQSKQQLSGPSVSIEPQRIPPLPTENNNQNQVSQNPTPDSQEKSPAIDRLIKALTSISPEALSEAVGEIETAVRFNDTIPEGKSLYQLPLIFDELGQPTFFTPEGWETTPIIPNIVCTPSTFASKPDSFNLVTDAAESDSNSFTVKAKRLKTVENQNVLEEIKYINNRLIDCEVVIDEKENVVGADKLVTEEIQGLFVKILFNAVTINQNLVSHFTSDKKSMMKPLWLVIPPSYPTSSLVILDELPLKVSEDLRDLFERAKGKLRFHLQSVNEPLLIKDIARMWERFAREAILDYAHANGGGTFTSMYGGWKACH